MSGVSLHALILIPDVSLLFLDVFVLFFSPAVAILLSSRYFPTPQAPRNLSLRSPGRPRLILPATHRASTFYPSLFPLAVLLCHHRRSCRPVAPAMHAGTHPQSGNSLHLKATVDRALPGDSGEYTPVSNHGCRKYKMKKTRHEVIWRRGCRRTRRDKIFFRP